jgi:hypothetical protein
MAVSPLTVSDPTAQLLRRHRTTIVEHAVAAVRRGAGPHDRAAGPALVRQRAEELLDQAIDAVETCQLGPLLAYARRVAVDRFQRGYELDEVQAAWNALEDAVWRELAARSRPRELEEALALITTVFGAAKDALASEYVRRAASAQAPSLDLRALAGGAGGATVP